jgi:flagellar motor switch protein FliM
MSQGTIHDLHGSHSPDPRRLAALQTLHEGLAKDFATALASLLRCPVEASLAGVDQLAYGDFISSLEPHSCFNLLKAEPLEERLMLDFEPAIFFPMIDRLLGGSREDEPPLRRPLSDIELRLAGRITRLILQELGRVWKGTLNLTPELLQIEDNPRSLRILPSDELVIVVGFVLSIGDQQGMMRLCLPCRVIERMGKPQEIRRRRSRLDVDVSLATSPIAAADLESLCVGDIIVTETSADSPAVVSIDGQPRFLAKPGVYQDRKAVRLTDTIENRPSASKDE